MNHVTIIPLTPKYKKDNGVYILDAQNVPLPDGFVLKEPSLVYVPAGEVAGNHRHPRQEAFVCFQQGAELHWLDVDGKKYIEKMNDEHGNAPLFVVPSLLPHAVVNTSKNVLTIMAYADGPLVDVELMPVVEASWTTTRQKRPDDDPVWPGQLHTAGNVIRATDTSYDTILQRILKDELQTNEVSQPVFVTNVLHSSGRGNESALVYWIELSTSPIHGSFHNTADLPDSVVKSQLDFIPLAVNHFRQTKHL